jgi:hypothetical protein
MRRVLSAGIVIVGFGPCGTFETAPLRPIDLDHRAIVNHDQQLSEPQPGERFDDRRERFAQSRGAGDGIDL